MSDIRVNLQGIQLYTVDNRIYAHSTTLAKFFWDLYKLPVEVYCNKLITKQCYINDIEENNSAVVICGGIKYYLHQTSERITKNLSVTDLSIANMAAFKICKKINSYHESRNPKEKLYTTELYIDYDHITSDHNMIIVPDNDNNIIVTCTTDNRLIYKSKNYVRSIKR